MEKSDGELIKMAQEGDDSAFANLLKQHLKPVFNFIARLVGNRTVAEDLAQITFIKIWKNIHRFDPDRNFKVWLFAIAKNTVYDYSKKKKTIPFSFFGDDERSNKLYEISEDKILPDEILEKENLANELSEKLKKIPEYYRTILILHYKEDFSLSEISEILSEPYNTVKSRHNRGLNELKKYFSGK